MEFDFDFEKNEMLFTKRGVTFYQVIETIAEKGVLLNITNPNNKKYPDQKMFVIEMNNYTYCVPYKIENQKLFLITIYPNRNYLYLIKGNKNDK